MSASRPPSRPATSRLSPIAGAKWILHGRGELTAVRFEWGKGLIRLKVQHLCRPRRPFTVEEVADGAPDQGIPGRPGLGADGVETPYGFIVEVDAEVHVISVTYGHVMSARRSRSPRRG